MVELELFDVALAAIALPTPKEAMSSTIPTSRVTIRFARMSAFPSP